ncbi:hypothetical protein ACIQOV_21600, partial [Kitasatospora sp. NPDC091257]
LRLAAAEELARAHGRLGDHGAAANLLHAEPTVQPGQVCNALAKRQSVSADLRSPLAGRTVVDRTSGQELPLEGDPHMGPDPVGPDVAGR